jgi:hypothetical protein
VVELGLPNGFLRLRSGQAPVNWVAKLPLELTNPTVDPRRSLIGTMVDEPLVQAKTSPLPGSRSTLLAVLPVVN